MLTYEITVDGRHAARVSVRDQIEMCAHVAAIRAVWDDRIDGYYPDIEEGGVAIRAELKRSY